MARTGLLLLALAAAICAGVEQPQPLQLHRGGYCSSLCVCSTWLRLPRASCTGQRLYSIHTGVLNVVQALDLSNNSIFELRDRELSVSTPWLGLRRP